MTRFAYTVLVWCLLLGGCATVSATSQTPKEKPATSWQASLDVDHPLVGSVWSRRARQVVDRETLFEALRQPAIVLVGERHDHPDHHALQAQILGRVRAGASVGFEMLDELDAPALKPGMTPQDVADATQWSSSGWPAFALYQPVFEVAHRRNLPIRALHPSRKRLMSRARNLAVHEAETAELIERLPAAGRAELRQDIRTSHCGQANAAMVTMMVAAQVFKDHFMARQLQAGLDADQQGVVIAGNGHVRRDYGLPNHLDVETVSIGLIEVRSGLMTPQDYAPERYDYVWFTPRLDDVDPCEKYREALENMKRRYRKLQR
ncbi:MAG: ChaN family lipoprotein [Myxococcota bacterium]|nr:ChaN family lipoprotein [Myxococcota bacterium]